MSTAEDPQPTLADIQATIEYAEEQLAERQRLAARHERAEAEMHEAEHAVTTARRALDEETADVARLESFSPARIWAGLRGDREAELDRERSEQQAAEYAVALAEHRRDMAVAERDVVRRTLEDLADAPQRRDEALRLKEEWLHRGGGPESEELADLGQAIGTARAERNEIIEALYAAAAALAALSHAGQALRGAESSSSTNGLLGGAYHFENAARLDESTRLMHRANAALYQLDQELADVEMPPIGYVWIDRLDRTWDVSIESVFMPRLSEKHRIANAQDQVTATHQRTHAADGQLRELLAGVDARLADLAERREALLLA